MTITQDLHDRLRAALPDAVPVLRPEDAQAPLHAAPVDAQGRPVVGAGERGLGAYLQQHPQGYVQIEAPLPTGSTGLIGTFEITVTAIAAQPATAATLGLQVRRILTGHPAAPAAYRETRPAEPQQVSGVWVHRPAYERKTLNGQLAGG